MTADTFISAISGMQGLLPPMIKHLISLAADLSDSERGDAVNELMELNNKMIANREEAAALYQGGIRELEQVLHVELPKMLRAEEKAEHQSDIDQAATNLQNL